MRCALGQGAAAGRWRRLPRSRESAHASLRGSPATVGLPGCLVLPVCEAPALILLPGAPCLPPPQDYVPSEHEEPASPPRVSASSRARSAVAATLSPATQAAVTMATLLGGGGQNGLPPVLPAVVGRPQVKKEESGGGDDDAADPDVTPEGLSTRATQRRQPQGEPGMAAGWLRACGWLLY